MENVKQFVIDYVEGKINSDTFLKQFKEDLSVGEWLQKNLVFEGETKPLYIFDQDYHVIREEKVPYNIKNSIDKILQEPGHSVLGRKLNVFSLVSGRMIKAFPLLNLIPDTTIEEEYDFMLNACPDYLDSVEINAAGIFENLMEQFPKSMPKTKRIKEFRKCLKEMFYVEGQKYPRWIQESEWPLSKTGKPTKFLRQKSVCKGEACYYYFQDMDTGEEIEVMQAY